MSFTLKHSMHRSTHTNATVTYTHTYTEVSFNLSPIIRIKLHTTNLHNTICFKHWSQSENQLHTKHGSPKSQ